MRVSSAYSRELAAKATSTYQKGVQQQTAAKKDIAAALGRPDSVKAAVAATVEGLFDLYERRNQVFIGIKEASLQAQQPGLGLDIYA